MRDFKPTFLVVDIAVVVDGKKLLLIRRAIPPHMDKLVFPGGHVDAPDPERGIKADLSVAHAGARESLEEMGLVIKPEDLRFLMILDAPGRDERQDARRVSIALIVHRTSAEVAGVRAASDAREIVRRKINSLRQEEFGFDHWLIALRLQHDLNVSRLFWNEKNEYGLPKHTCPAMVDNGWSNDIEIIYSFEENGAFIECTENGPADFSERINLCPVCGVTCPHPTKAN